jgi:NAD(P)-dependent dehydrogenase (short-subunit alcohol dehydrogenase family)
MELLEGPRMAKIFITGSADGLGAATAQRLAREGHEVVLHARNSARGEDAMHAVPQAGGVIVADISTLAGCLRLAESANALATFDAVVHNAAVFHRTPHDRTADGYAPTFAVNTLAPYVLTVMMAQPRRLIYLSSDMHAAGRADFDDLGWTRRSWDGSQAYSDSKLHATMLAFAVARLWPGVHANAVDPGWVRTKMGGSSAPDGLDIGSETQAWLAAADDHDALKSGQLFHHKKTQQASRAARDTALQDALLARLSALTGLSLDR